MVKLSRQLVNPPSSVNVTSSRAEIIFLMGLREVWQGKQSQSEC